MNGMKCSSFSQYVRQAFQTHEIGKLLQHHLGGQDYTDKQVQIFLRGAESGAHAAFHSLTTTYAEFAGTLARVHAVLAAGVTQAAKLGHKEDHDVMKSALDHIDSCYAAHVSQNIAIYTIDIEKEWAVPSRFLTGKQLVATDAEAEKIGNDFFALNQFKAMTFLSGGSEAVAKIEASAADSFSMLIQVASLSTPPSFTLPQMGRWAIDQARKVFDTLNERAAEMFEVTDDSGHPNAEIETMALMSRIMKKGPDRADNEEG